MCVESSLTLSISGAWLLVLKPIDLVLRSFFSFHKKLAENNLHANIYGMAAWALLQRNYYDIQKQIWRVKHSMQSSQRRL